MLHPWYADDTAMSGTARHNSNLLHAVMEKGLYHRYLPDPERSWHIFAEGKEKEEVKSDFDAKGIKVRFTRGQKYLGGFCGRQEEMEQWIRPKVQ